MFGGDSINHLSLSDPHSEEESKPSRRHWSLTRLITKRRRSDHERVFGHLEDRFIRIALRVSLYPLAMIVVNTLIAAGDLYITVNGVTTTPGYALYCVYYWFYGGRGMVFCCLALFVDPCLSKGVYAAWQAKHPTKHDTLPTAAKEPWGSEFAPGPVNTLDNAPVATVLDSFGGDGVAAPQNSLQRVESGNSMDMLQALFASEPPHVIEEQRRAEAKAVRDAARAARRQSRRSSVAFWRRGSRDVETPPTPPPPAPISLPPTAAPMESPAEMEFAGVDAAFLPAEFAELPDVVAPEALAAAAEEERERREAEEREAAERAAAAAAAAAQAAQVKELDRISEHSGASTPNLVTTLAYMARGRRASRVSAPPESVEGSGARSPNGGHGSPAFASYRSSAAPEWASGYGASRQSRTSADGPRTPADGRSRRQRALEIAEKLYEEMEQQL